jgi:hypothetical protein
VSLLTIRRFPFWGHRAKARERDEAKRIELCTKKSCYALQDKCIGRKPVSEMKRSESSVALQDKCIGRKPVSEMERSESSNARRSRALREGREVERQVNQGEGNKTRWTHCGL